MAKNRSFLVALVFSAFLSLSTVAQKQNCGVTVTLSLADSNIHSANLVDVVATVQNFDFPNLIIPRQFLWTSTIVLSGDLAFEVQQKDMTSNDYNLRLQETNLYFERPSDSSDVLRLGKRVSSRINIAGYFVGVLVPGDFRIRVTYRISKRNHDAIDIYSNWLEFSVKATKNN
jgi:hypothetical protein